MGKTILNELYPTIDRSRSDKHFLYPECCILSRKKGCPQWEHPFFFFLMKDDIVRLLDYPTSDIGLGVTFYIHDMKKRSTDVEPKPSSRSSWPAHTAVYARLKTAHGGGRHLLAGEFL